MTDTKPKKWYQWMLLYPTLAVSLVGSVPTAFEAIRSNQMGTSWGDSSKAVEQHSMWTRNFDCTKETKPVKVLNEANIEVSALVCPSGDILVAGKKPGDSIGNFMWVSLDVVLAGEGAGLLPGLIATAFADNRIPVEANWITICQRWVGRGKLYTRVKSGGVCYDRYINTYTNTILSSTQVNCTSACK